MSLRIMLMTAIARKRRHRMHPRPKCCLPSSFVLGLAVVLYPWPVMGGDPQKPNPPTSPLSLNQAVEYALANHPSIRAALSQVEAAIGSIDLARTAYLPRTDMILMANRATRNNVFGMLLPQSVIPPISGPVLGETAFGSVWGSAAGTLFSWEPFDFGVRRANVSLAGAVRDQARAGATVTELQVAFGVADTFLRVLASHQTVRAARANVERMQVFADSVGVLVRNQLRPGADESRARAELALARTQLIQAEQAEQVSRATLAERLGIAGNVVQVDAGPLLQLPPQPVPPSTSVSTHPVAVAQATAVEAVRVRQQALDRSYFPRFNFQSTFYARGTGAEPNGGLLSGLNGLAMDRPNWAVGMSVTFPLFEYASLRVRKQIEAQNERTERARYDQVVQNLTGELERARAQADGAQRVAENTPIQLEAARATELQARTRYQAGLATIVEVAEAQRLLLQAEIDDVLARLRVWGALLAQAAAEGDIKPFLEKIRSQTPGGN